MTEVHVQVVGYPDSDEEERADLASRLQEEIRANGIDDVSHPESEAVPGSKGAGLEWAQLAVSFAGVAPSLVMAIQGWLGRHPNAALTLEIDGDKVIVEDPSPAERQRLLEVFFERHGG